jgi:solute carrier family 34 (sodium-dependent phosphate cotransporter)
MIKAIAAGKGTCEEGGGFYPIICEPGTPTYSTCPQVGLIGCNKRTNRCPAFFQIDATSSDDKVSGGVMLFLSLVLLFVCLGCLVYILCKMLGTISNRVIYKATSINPYLAMALGCMLTMLVQSSSVTTATMIPLIAVDAISLEKMYTVALGANLGTVRST